MPKNRLEALSDGVFAVIITIMVLELKAPHTSNLEDLWDLGPTFLSYILSFVYVAIYWNNHHHLYQLVQKVNGSVMWANFHLLFWLSLLPFTTAWCGQNQFTPVPVAVYGLNFLFCAIAYSILEHVLIGSHGQDSVLARAMDEGLKEKVSTGLYVLGIILSHWWSWLGIFCYFIVATIWVIPDKRVEKALDRAH